VWTGLKPVHAWFTVSQETHVRVFFNASFPACFVAKHPAASVREDKNKLDRQEHVYTDSERRND